MKNRQLLWFVLFFVTGFGIILSSGFYTHFHVAGNDFWSPLYYGRHISWGQKESLYNGFYPIGYAFLVGQFPYSYAIQWSYILNALLAGLLTASIVSLASSTRSVPATALAFIFSLSLPIIFQYSNTVGPDIGAAALTACAIHLLWHNTLAAREEGHSTLLAASAGICLGLAVLWRNHGIVSSAVILGVYWIISGLRPIRYKLSIAGFFMGVFSIQVVVNILSGHGPFETTQAFNMYKLFYGVDWTNPPAPADIAGFTVWKPIMENPRGFIVAYYPWFRFLASFAWPGIVCMLITPWKSALSKFGLFSALVMILYAIPLALGDSLRAPLTTIALFISPLAVGFFVLIERISALSGPKNWIPSLVTVLILAGSCLFTYRWLVSDWDFLQTNRAEHRIFSNVEQTLQAGGMLSPDQVFADRLDFYFPNQPPYLPRQIEGFFYSWVWGYSQEYPRLTNDSWAEFAAACREQGIRYLVLSPNSRYRGDFFPPIYDHFTEPATLGLRFITQRGNLRIFEFSDFDS